MTDLGGFDARATVVSSAQEQEAVFVRHRARMQAMTDPTIHNPRLLMQDTDRRLFAWFLSRVDARWALRRALVG